jgi:hypothetical protein
VVCLKVYTLMVYMINGNLRKVKTTMMNREEFFEWLSSCPTHK